MNNYFSIFPKTYYQLNDNSSVDIVTNLLTRFTIETNVKDNVVMYFKYDIRDGETPEIVSSKFYNTPYRHWLILMLNNIVDIETQWPLDGKQFERYLNQKYGDKDPTKTGVVWSKSNTHSYYKVEKNRISGNDKINYEKYRVDVNTYTAITESYNNTFTLPDGNVYYYDTLKETKSYYDYESEENEKKRSIQLLRKEFAAPLEEQVKKLLVGRE